MLQRDIFHNNYMNELALTSLRESTNRMNELVLIDGQLSVSSKIRVINEESLAKLASCVHRRDKIACIVQTEISGIKNIIDKPLVVVNTSKKHDDGASSVVCIRDKTLVFVDADIIDAGDVVVGIYVMHLSDAPTSFARYES